MNELSHSTNMGCLCRPTALNTPDRVAVIDLSGDAERRISYGELDRRLTRVASMLRAHGLRQGDTVAIGIGNRVEFIEAAFGAMRAGLVALPLNIRLGPEALLHVLQDSNTRAVIADPHANTALPSLCAELNIRPRFLVDGEAPGWFDFVTERDKAEDFSPMALGPEDLIMLLYTSGSTGRPKGVPHLQSSQAWTLDLLNRLNPGAYRDGCAIAVLPLFHKNALVGVVKPLLANGGCVVILPRFEPLHFLQTAARYKVTYIGGVPALFLKLLAHRDVIRSLDLSSLKALAIGSAPAQRELLEDMRATFGVPVRQGYGITEGGAFVLSHMACLDEDPPLDSCGKPPPGVEVLLLDAQNQETNFGELWTRNPGVAPGYHNLPELTSQRFREGWIRTGDVFMRDARGFYYFRGRTDDMLICGGENVYPVEVEDILMRHPDIDVASVVAVPDSVKGEVPAAMVVLRPHAKITTAQIKDYFIRNGPAYAHPRHIEIVPELPLNGPGKIDRARIAQIMRESAARARRTLA